MIGTGDGSQAKALWWSRMGPRVASLMAQMTKRTQVNKAPWKFHGHDHLALSEVRPREAWPGGDQATLFPSQILGWSEANF